MTSTWVLCVDASFETVATHLPELTDAGLQGAAEVDGRTELYFAARNDDLTLDGRWVALADRDWHELWRAGLTPVAAGRWTVTPSWLATGAADELVIDPGQAFGTGHHETTLRCLDALDRCADEHIAGSRVLDVGTGTGVLAIAAARRGATVVAIDIDPLAVSAAQANAQINRVQMSVLAGSIDAIGDDRFDVVIANIDTITIVSLASALATALAQRGRIIISGVSNERAAEAVDALEAAGLHVDADAGHQWCLLTARHGEQERSMSPDVGAEFEIDLTGPAGGGVTVGRLPDGRACFVDYAIPGERVRVRITERRKRWARAELVEVIDASPDRVTPPCPVYGPRRCGGCRMQHVAPERQTALLATVITDQLRRIGRLDVGEVAVLRPHDGDGFGYRSRARFAVDGAGHLAFRRAGSTALQPVDDCPLLEPAGRELLGRSATGWDGAREVRVQLGDDGSLALAVTGDRGATPPQTVTTTAGHDAPHVWRTVAGRRFRVSARSFFQPSTAGATLLADLVRQHTRVSTGEHVVDCYAGVGLFSALLADDGAHVTAIERDAAACADARSNTAGLPVTVQRAEVGPDSTVPDTVDAVVLDPPRIGAGADVMRWIARMDPARVIYVSCDAATFARDARVLVDQRYALDHVVGVDQFTHTGHVEMVGVFHRPTSSDRS